MATYEIEYRGDSDTYEPESDGIDGWEEAVRAVVAHRSADDAQIEIEWIGTGPGRAVAEYAVQVDGVSAGRAQVYRALATACASCGSYPAAPGSRMCAECAGTGLDQHEAFAG